MPINTRTVGYSCQYSKWLGIEYYYPEGWVLVPKMVGIDALNGWVYPERWVLIHKWLGISTPNGVVFLLIPERLGIDTRSVGCGY